MEETHKRLHHLDDAFYKELCGTGALEHVLRYLPFHTVRLVCKHWLERSGVGRHLTLVVAPSFNPMYIHVGSEAHFVRFAAEFQRKHTVRAFKLGTLGVASESLELGRTLTLLIRAGRARESGGDWTETGRSRTLLERVLTPETAPRTLILSRGGEGEVIWPSEMEIMSDPECVRRWLRFFFGDLLHPEAVPGDPAHAKCPRRFRALYVPPGLRLRLMEDDAPVGGALSTEIHCFPEVLAMNGISNLRPFYYVDQVLEMRGPHTLIVQFIAAWEDLPAGLLPGLKRLVYYPLHAHTEQLWKSEAIACLRLLRQMGEDKAANDVVMYVSDKMNEYMKDLSEDYAHGGTRRNLLALMSTRVTLVPFAGNPFQHPELFADLEFAAPAATSAPEPEIPLLAPAPPPVIFGPYWTPSTAVSSSSSYSST